MTDNEIIKALECCTYSVCGKCPYDKKFARCTEENTKDVIALITRQKAEIERLEHKYDMAVAEREANMKGFLEELNRWNKETQKARAEAIKEFAERLKGMFAEYSAYDRLHTYEIIDKIEIVEEEMEKKYEIS